MKLSRRFASRKDHHQKGGEFVSAGEGAATRIKVPTMERAERARHRAAPLRPSASAGHPAFPDPGSAFLSADPTAFY